MLIIKTPKYKEPDTSQWHTGDIFFSVGDSWKSVVVRAITGAKRMELHDSLPSHCGMIIKEKGRIWLVHESTEKGILVRESVEDYQRLNGSYCLFAGSIPCAVDTDGLRKDINNWLRSEKPFDFDFDHSDSTSFYCTEFVVEALERNGCEFLHELRKNKYIYPKDLQSICNKP
ncbi:MAG: hypothetical protein K2N05_00180 [Muribaculaceae bacterium]|nr:hypothetical protein [Muribaculaceae bacterium]